MTTTPVTLLSMNVGDRKNRTVVDQGGNPLPNADIAWSVIAGTLTFGTSGVAQNLIITPDMIFGGFSFFGNSAGSGTMRATHLPSGHTVDHPVTIASAVTLISLVEVT